METIDQTATTVQRPKTYFEEVIGWIFIILGGMNVLGGLFSLGMYAFTGNAIYLDPETEYIIEEVPMLATMMKYSLNYTVLGLLTSSLMVIFSIGLLKKRHWGRIGFSVIMVVNILTMLGMLYFMNLFFAEMGDFLINETGTSERAAVEGVVRVIQVVVGIFVIAFAGLYAWIVYRLNSAKIKERFS
jgi:hypothetical protein